MSSEKALKNGPVQHMDLVAKYDGKVVSYREALFASMHAALASDPKVIIIGQGVDDHKGIFGSTVGLAAEFGRERVMDTPLAEEATAGIAVGAALNGLYPIQTHIRADFALVAANQIINLVAKYKYMFGGRFSVPMLIRMVVGRSWGQGAQHSQSLQSLFAHIPGLTVIMPASAQSIMASYPWVVSQYPAPVISIEHRLMYDLQFRVTKDAMKADNPLTSFVVRPGRDVTIVATSIMVLEAVRAADHLAQVAGIECEVIDVHCLSHPDHQLVFDSVRKTGKLIVADTSWMICGVCAEVCRWICERDPSVLKKPSVMVGMQPAPCPTAKGLEDMYYPNLQTLADSVARLVTGNALHGIPLPDEHSMADVYKRFRGPF
ncbi:MAG TPA: transketolase C-terminal domain-containing protein [Kiritimatiellia bacterium]|nr:transketolase C-terminal domain-containing protein [Kiritimatiellia bacterium]